MNDKFEIKIDYLFSDFKEHVEIPGNDRILFSAGFGVGKTYFLKEFFKSESEKYFVVHLHPTNYQIANNTNILDILKKDIALNIFSQTNKIDEKLTSYSETTINSKLYKTLIETGNSIPVINTFFTGIDKIAKEVVQITEVGINDYLEHKHVKGKAKILIIDDFDRIDPEHIFRIINIFSSFVGEEENEEQLYSKKLGFNKVVFVGDSKNLKGIFKHKYGENVDYSGYFDKLYNIEPFEYKGIEYSYFKKINDEFYGHFKKTITTENSNMNFSSGITALLPLLLFLKNDPVNLRQLKVLLECIPAKNKLVKPSDVDEFLTRKRLSTFCSAYIKLLITMFKGKNSLIDFIENIDKYDKRDAVAWEDFIDRLNFYNAYLFYKIVMPSHPEKTEHFDLSIGHNISDVDSGIKINFEGEEWTRKNDDDYKINLKSNKKKGTEEEYNVEQREKQIKLFKNIMKVIISL